MTILKRAAAPFAVLLLPITASAAINNFSDLAATIIGIINAGTGILLVLIIVVYFWGLMSNFHKLTEDGGEKLRAYLLWGLLAVCIVFSIWGILQFLGNSIFPA